MDPQYGPLPALKGSELWAPILKVVYNDLPSDNGFDEDSIGSTLERCSSEALRKSRNRGHTFDDSKPALPKTCYTTIESTVLVYKVTHDLIYQRPRNCGSMVSIIG